MFYNSVVVIRKLDGNSNMGSRWCSTPIADINGWVDAINHAASPIYAYYHSNKSLHLRGMSDYEPRGARSNFEPRVLPYD